LVNWDLGGWDYFSVPNITHWVDCQIACNQDTKCQAWTYVQDRQINNNCFMKSGVPFLTPNTVCISGVKQRNYQQLIWIYINRTLSQKNPNAARGPVHAPLWMKTASNDNQWFLELDIFIDHSVIEVFEPQGGRAAITARVYPEEEDAKNLAVYALQIPTNNDTIVMKSLDFWALNTIWT
jgi:sucrose-6-phosphate hydrolase SacC (GH32 family)